MFARTRMGDRPNGPRLWRVLSPSTTQSVPISHSGMFPPVDFFEGPWPYPSLLFIDGLDEEADRRQEDHLCDAGHSFPSLGSLE